MVRKIRAKLVLQLRAEGLSGRAIAASQQMTRKSVTAVLDAADAAGVAWAEVAGQSEGEVYSRLFPGRGEHESVFAAPDWDLVHREMARAGVTLKLLHGEYTDSCTANRTPAMENPLRRRCLMAGRFTTGLRSGAGAARIPPGPWRNRARGNRARGFR